MAPKLQNVNDYSTPNGLSIPNPKTIITKRSPTAADTGYTIGTIWINKTASESYQMVSTNVGTAVWVLIGGLAGFPITPFVVGPMGQAGYQTIQSAVNAAQAAGGGIVYIQPGTYNENVNMGVGVDLVGLIGCDGNIGYTLPGGEVLPVQINGNFTLNLIPATVTPFVEFKNISFNANSGVVFTYVGNTVLLESGYITFDNCQLQASGSATFIFSNDGFFNVNLQASQIFTNAPNAANLITFGVTPFLNLNVRDSHLDINAITAAVFPTGCFNVFTFQNSFLGMRIDASTGVQTLQITAVRCALNPNAASPSAPMINYGSNSGSFIATNCTIFSASGSIADSTAVTAADVFRYNNCIWNNPLILGANGRGQFSFCEFYGGTAAAFTMGSAQNVSINNSIINSTNNPSIAGSGAGILSLNNNTWIGNSGIAGTLTLTGTTFIPTTNTALSSGTLSVKSTTANPGNNAGFIEILVGGITAWVPYFTNIAP